MPPLTKIARLRDLMAQQDWQAAMRLAARFPRLGLYRNAILDAHLAYTNPRFVEQLGKSPEVLIAAGRDALRAAYAPSADTA